MTARVQEGVTKTPHRDTAISYLEPVLWKQLTEAETDQSFCLAWLRLQCLTITDAISAVVFLRNSQNSSYDPIASWPESFDLYQQFSTVVDKILIEKKGIVLRAGNEVSGENPGDIHLGYPLIINDSVVGMVTIALPQRSAGDIQYVMRQLQWGVAWLKNWLMQTRIEPDSIVRERLMKVFDIVALTLQEQRFKSSTSKLVTELAARLNCDRVSAGFSVGTHTKVTTLSHSAKFAKQSNLTRAIENAMDEALDQGRTIVFPPLEEKQGPVTRAHAELARLHGSGAICSSPFIDNNQESYGALTFERPSDRPFEQEEEALIDAISAISGPILREKRKNDRWLLFKIADSFKDLLAQLLGPGHLVLKFIMLLLVAASVFFYIYKSDYRVTAATALEGTVQRAVTCPFDAFLEKTYFRAGDVVAAGTVLATLNVRDLTLEQLKWVAEEEQRMLEYRKALADNEIALSNIILEQINQSKAQIKLLQQHIDRSEIKAPLSGILISGDLDHSIGAPMKKGEVLFEIAPLDSYRIVAEVDEKDIRDIRLQQEGELVLNSIPEDSFSFVINKITPVSTTREGRNFFVIEGALIDKSERLRPGMQGYGKIFIDRRRLIWIWTHGLIDWGRLWLWSWLP